MTDTNHQPKREEKVTDVILNGEVDALVCGEVKLQSTTSSIQELAGLLIELLENKSVQEYLLNEKINQLKKTSTFYD